MTYQLFIFDSTLTILFNYPPRCALSEMATGLPCSDELFEATSGKDCQEVASLQAGTQQQPSSLKTCVDLLTADNVSAEAKARLTKSTPLHLFILVHGKPHEPCFVVIRRG